MVIVPVAAGLSPAEKAVILAWALLLVCEAEEYILRRVSFGISDEIPGQEVREALRDLQDSRRALNRSRSRSRSRSSGGQ